MKRSRGQRRRLLGSSLLLEMALLLANTAAHAAESSSTEKNRSTEPRRRAVVAVSPARQESLALLKAELQALGLEVIEAPLPSTAQPSETIAPADDPVAEFRIVLRPTHVEVWIFDRAAGKVTLREVFSESDGRALDTRTAVLHAVELLHWHLRERDPKTRRGASAQQRSRLGVPSTSTNDANSTKHSNESNSTSLTGADGQSAWLFSLLPQVLYSPGGTSSSLGAQVDVARRWSRWGARIFGSSVLVPSEIVSKEGSAQVTSRFIGLEGVLLSSEAPTTSGLEASVGLGITLISTHLRGSAAMGFRAHDDQLLTLAPVLDLRVSYSVSRAVAISLCSSFMAPLRSSTLRFVDREAGHYGQFITSFGLGPRITVF